MTGTSRRPGGGRLARGARGATRGAEAAGRGVDRAFETIEWLAGAVRRAALLATFAAGALWLACLLLFAPSSGRGWLGAVALLVVLALPAAVLWFTASGLQGLPDLRRQAGDLVRGDSELRTRLAERLDAARRGGGTGVVAAARGMWTVRGVLSAAKGAVPAVKVLRAATLLWAVLAIGAAIAEVLAVPVVLIIALVLRVL